MKSPNRKIRKFTLTRKSAKIIAHSCESAVFAFYPHRAFYGERF
ncbi:hypothetical protein CAMRE0001_0123 [Campylobacter rectus RM3267]|uniref:Uncharacterized protein n=1 Tax=Campylobacter rectus RM3267 TaxID=553218 RepID=B9CXT4_CAMRE|nr:hypothetical protein CAMRE0001_0123 [Campylobacter rectus RM3267]